jgi:retron-type reverse transcriptase
MRNNQKPIQISLFDFCQNRGVISRERVNWLRHSFYFITSFENLLESWREFLPGKRKRKDVAEFSLNLSGNLLDLHLSLRSKTYRHGGYVPFKINDPKPRKIHKASVRDRLVHHAICRVLFPCFEQKFIFNSYSCRKKKGTHRAMNRFREYAYIVSKNNTKTCWILKCDIKKFFASIDQKILLSILSQHIIDKDTIWLLDKVISSFHSGKKTGAGLPLGNLTSQLLINVFMNKFDQFALRELKAKYYVRYADDFVILSADKTELENYLPIISDFLLNKLNLQLNWQKVQIKTLDSGVDFLGWVHFPDHRVLRKSTKMRMLRRISENKNQQSYQSYLGIISHGNSRKVRNALNDLRFS